MTFFKKTLRDVPIDGQTVLVRADYNVPLDKDGTIRDDLRIRASLPTLQYLLDHGCKVVIISHLGRPEGKRDMTYSLRPVADRLATLLNREVRLADNCIGDRAYQTAKTATPQTIVLFENLRFHAEEEENNGYSREQLPRRVAPSIWCRMVLALCTGHMPRPMRLRGFCHRSPVCY